MSQLNDVNEFSFVGTLVNKRALEKASYMTLGIFRKISSRNRVADYPRMVVYGEDVRTKLEKTDLHEKLVVKGYVSSSNPKKVEAKTGRTHNPPQIFVATSIEPAPTVLKENLGIEDDDGSDSGRTFIPDKNEIKLIGTVQRSYFGRGGNINILLAVTREEGKYLKFVHVSRFPFSSENTQEYAKPGTRVGVVGTVRTTRKPSPDGKKNVNYETIVADAIAPI